MLHACVERFDVMCVRGNILGWKGEVNAALGRFFTGTEILHLEEEKSLVFLVFHRSSFILSSLDDDIFG
jgi:hypothetical protein